MAQLIDDRRVYIPPPPPPPPPPPAPVPPPGPQERLHTVRPGDTLNGIAREYTRPDAQVTAQEIADRNAITVDDAIHPGDGLVVPTVRDHLPPATPPATPEAQRVDTALQDHLLAQDNLAVVNAAPGPRNDPEWQAHVADFRQQAADSRVELQDAVDAQIQADFAASARPTGDILDTTTITHRGDAIAQRYAADPAAQTAIREATREVGIDHEVDGTLTTAGAMADAESITRYLGDTLPTLSAEAQSRLLSGSEYGALIDQRVAPALTDPLQGEPWLDSDGAQVQVRESVEALRTLTADTDPRVAADLVGRQLGALDGLQTRALDAGYGLMIGPEGTRMLEHIAGDIAGTPQGDALVQRMAGLPLNGLTLGQGVAEGASPELILAVAAAGGGERMVQQALDGVRQFQAGIEDNANAYIEHIEELNYLIGQGGVAAATPEQLGAAIDQYVADRGSEWQQRLESLQNQLADDGARLLEQTQAMSAALDTLPVDLRDDVRDRGAEILRDPISQLAVTTALRQQPELARGAEGERLIESFNALGIRGNDDALAATATAAYLRENVLAPSVELDFGDPASLAAARGEINAALRDSPALAQMLGVTPDQLNGVADSLLELVPSAPTAVDSVAGVNNVARNLNNTLDKLDAAFGRDTPFSLQFRTTALGIVSTGLVNSAGNFADDPSFRNGLQVMVDSARVGVDGAQFVAAVADIPKGSLTVGLKTAGKVVHVLGASLAGLDALGRLGQGDLVGAGLNAAAGGGVLYGALNTARFAGPIGFGVATVATLGLFVYDSVNAAEHNSRFETQAAQEFLADVGFDAEAATVLHDQSGQSHSPVPFLMRYGEASGLDRAQTVAWINDLPPPALERLRDVAHAYLDANDGNVSGFAATAPSDGDQLADIDEAMALRERMLQTPAGAPPQDPVAAEPWLLGLENVTLPESAAVLDRFLELWQLPRPS